MGRFDEGLTGHSGELHGCPDGFMQVSQQASKSFVNQKLQADPNIKSIRCGTSTLTRTGRQTCLRYGVRSLLSFITRQAIIAHYGGWGAVEEEEQQKDYDSYCDENGD